MHRMFRSEHGRCGPQQIAGMPRKNLTGEISKRTCMQQPSAMVFPAFRLCGQGPGDYHAKLTEAVMHRWLALIPLTPAEARRILEVDTIQADICEEKVGQQGTEVDWFMTMLRKSVKPLAEHRSRAVRAPRIELPGSDARPPPPMALVNTASATSVASKPRRYADAQGSGTGYEYQDGAGASVPHPRRHAKMVAWTSSAGTTTVGNQASTRQYPYADARTSTSPTTKAQGGFGGAPGGT